MKEMVTRKPLKELERERNKTFSSFEFAEVYLAESQASIGAAGLSEPFLKHFMINCPIN